MNNDKVELKNRMHGSLMGGVVGDALGSPFEFKYRDSYVASGEMVYNDMFDLPAGSFTDDSSMMLCLAKSLTENQGFNPTDQIEKYFDWMTKGYMSSSPKEGCFDIGRTTSDALHEYYRRKRESPDMDHIAYCGSTANNASGNGGIMRLAPIPVMYWRNEASAAEAARLSSAVTHGSSQCLESADLMARIIIRLLRGLPKSEATAVDPTLYECSSVQRLARGDYIGKPRDDIYTSGYVIHSLEAALWAFEKYDNFEEGMVVLLNMGNDVDTVCCIYGQIAGASYGADAIPKRWIDALQMKEMVTSIMVDLEDLALEDWVMTS